MRFLSLAACVLTLACGRVGFDGQPTTDPDASVGGDPDATPGLPFTVLEPTKGAVGDNFGWSVALSGDLLVSGAPTVSVGETETGAAYVFGRKAGTWSELGVLSPTSVLTDGARLGERVAIAGDTILVSASGFDGVGSVDVGAVLAFQDNGAGYVQSDLLLAEDGASSDFFGIALAAEGERAIIGAHYDDPLEQGAAYIFDVDGPGFVGRAKLVGESVNASDNFGAAVAIGSDSRFVAVGAPYKEGTDAADAVAVGAVYVFELDGDIWRERADIRPPEPHSFMYFGFSVAIDGEWLAIGASQHNLPDRTDAGLVYIYQRNLDTGAWAFYARVEPSDSESDAQFGYQLALRGSRLVVGAPFFAGGVGAMYRFDLSGPDWLETKRFYGITDQVDAHLGEGVAFRGDTLIGGAHRAFDAAGRVYISE